MAGRSRAVMVFQAWAISAVLKPYERSRLNTCITGSSGVKLAAG